MGELREVEAQLMEGSAWAKRLWRGGFTAASSSPACRWAVAVFWVPGARDWGREGVEWKEEDGAVLVRSLEKEKGLCPELATAAVKQEVAGTGPERRAGGADCRRR